MTDYRLYRRVYFHAEHYCFRGFDQEAIPAVDWCILILFNLSLYLYRPQSIMYLF